MEDCCKKDLLESRLRLGHIGFHHAADVAVLEGATTWNG